MLVCTVASAQRIYWEPNAGSLAFEQISPLQLVFENCAPKGDPALPALDGLELQFTISEQNVEMVNRRVTRRNIFNFDARPTKRPEVSIPAFDVETDKGTMHVEPATFAVGNATIGRTAVPLETAASARLAPADGAFWAGEVFSITYTLDLAERFQLRGLNPIAWKPAPLIMEDWMQPEQFSTTSGGEPRVGWIYKARGYIATAGSYQIPAASQEMVLSINTGGFLLNPFAAPEVVQHTVTSNALSLTVKPLPDGAPADFAGAVGQFTLTSKVVPLTVGVGEPVTWTLDLSGTGNWPDIHGLPAREVSRDFKALQPQAKRTPAAGKLFDATLSEDVVLIPTKPGTYKLPSVSYSYFDPGTGNYETVRTDPVTVTVTPAGAGEPSSRPFFVPPSSTTPRATTSATGTSTAQLAAPPVLPAAIPRDPLRGSDTGWEPLPAWVWYLWLLASVIWLIPAWLVLAALRSRQTDPLRPRREARQRLGRILSSLPASSDAVARVRALQAWQRDVAALLDIPHAAPTPALLARHAHRADGTKPAGADGEGWASLWAEADRALYGRENTLPKDWVLRAEAALDTTRVPAWQSSSLFQPHNLLPWFASFQTGFRKVGAGKITSAIILLALFTVIRSPASAAPDDSTGAAEPPKYYASPRDAFNAGDFGAAEQGWRDTVTREPTDWIARHNLGIALAQQGHWPEAAAQWTSAFLLNPRDESVRWHLALGYERAAYTPPGFGELALASGPHLLARLASPAEWQWLLVGAGGLLATGLLWLLIRAYRHASNDWTQPAALAVLALALLIILSAVLSLHFYGEAADPRAAIAWHQASLRSIPTEADTQQKTSSLPAGSLGIVDQEYIGWVRLVFANGQTGWVRKQDIVWLYR